MSNYEWKFTRCGGITRVDISTAEDIKHIPELDKKMWTVLSCPVCDLEIDPKSLRYMDADNDGHIRIEEVKSVAKWLTNVYKDLKPVLEQYDHLPLEFINQESEEGKQIYDAAKAILEQLGQTDNDLSMEDSAQSLDSYRKSKLEEALAEVKKQAEVAAPYGELTEAVAEAYKELDAKVRDYFMRAKLTLFSSESTAALDVQVTRIEAISADNLTDKVADIASQPIARVKEGQLTLPLDAPINPAWADKFSVIRGIIDKDDKELSEEQWTAIGTLLTKYADYQKSISITEDDITLDDEIASKQLVDKLLHLTRDYMTLIDNYITFKDFYRKDKLAIFQAGTLVVDQRTCDLCVKVVDAAAMAAQAAKSNMYLITCDCINQPTGKTCTVIAAITEGDIDDIFVGKNCVFYDRQGLDYDARITSIVDNPISLKQAAWSPYRKFGNFVTEQIEKFAAEKENGILSDATAKFTDAKASVENADTKGTLKGSQKAGEQAAASFDIAKICGVFAAIGMALGYIGSFALAIFTGFISLSWWQMPLTILALLIVISGPSMFLAWLALRRRNMAPILNANGWAVNADAKINLPFGATLTTCAKYPIKLKGQKDEYDDSTNPLLKAVYWLIALFFIALIVGNALGHSSKEVVNKMKDVANGAAGFVVQRDSTDSTNVTLFGGLISLPKDSVEEEELTDEQKAELEAKAAKAAEAKAKAEAEAAAEAKDSLSDAIGSVSAVAADVADTVQAAVSPAANQ